MNILMRVGHNLNKGPMVIRVMSPFVPLLKKLLIMALFLHTMTISRLTTDYFTLSDLMIAAIAVLDQDQRSALISLIPNAYFIREFVFSLVGNNLKLYQSLLNNDLAKEIHLAPLSRTPIGCWFDMVKLAQQKGIRAKDIALTIIYEHGVADASIEAWKNRVKIFSELCNHEDEFIRQIGSEGRKYSQKNLDTAIDEDHLEQVYGIR